jgi:hypothetical protein
LLIQNLFRNSILLRAHSFLAYILVVLLGYIFLILLRLNGSSMGLLSDNGEGLLVGASRWIRSDEYLRGTPTEIGALLHPGSPGISLLSSQGFDEPGIDAFELLRPERFVIQVLLGGDYGFSAIWWLPALLVLVGVPLLLKQFQLPLNISVAIGLIIVLSPAVVWWSNGIASIIGRMSLGVALIIMASCSKGWRVWVLTFLGGWVASGVAMDYQPWSIVASLFFSPIVLYFIFQKRKLVVPMVLSGILSLIPLMYFLYSKLDVFQVMSSTLYPGQRRVTSGLANAWNWSMAAPQQWSLLNPDGIIYSNQSEISMGYFLFIFPALFFAYTSITSVQKFGLREIVLGSYLIATSWAFVSYPEIPFNPLSLVSPERALPFVTTLAPLVFGLLYANRILVSKTHGEDDFVQGRQSDLWSKIALAIFVMLSTFGSSQTMEGVVLNFSAPIAFVVAVLCGLITFMIISSRFTSKGVWSFAALALLIAGPVNPIAQGTAPLTDNSLTKAIAGLDSDGVWASDGIHLDAILIANGKPSVSGQQLTGPNKDQWRLIDPQGLSEPIWNAGASFVVISWDSTLLTPEISRPLHDTILIRTSPCSAAMEKLSLGVVLSRTQQTAPCLIESAIGSVEYLGGPVFIYEIMN